MTLHINQTRMHSSRMRTVHTLTVEGGGGYLPGGFLPRRVPAQGGTCPGGTCLGGVPARGVYLPGGCTCHGGCTCWGGYWPGGVPAWGVYLPGGCTCLGGVPCDLSHHAFDVTCMLPPHQLRPTNSTAAYIVLVQGMLGYTPPPVNRITDRCKNITLANYVHGR